jgi:hypothetical protein
MNIDDAEKKAEQYLLGKEKLNIKEVHVTSAKFEVVANNWTYVVSGWVTHKDQTRGDFEVGIDESGQNIRSWSISPRKPSR